MADRTGPRPGGRSARVQAAVHQAVHELLQTMGREALTVPAIAARAGVTPSTIYRRWGDLTQLLSDVAVANMQPDGEPPDTGSLRGDLETWVDQYLDEMSSGPGQAMMRDVLTGANADNACRCADLTRAQLGAIIERARARGEAAPDSDALMDHVVSPLVYRILFSTETPTVAYAQGLLDAVLANATATA